MRAGAAAVNYAEARRLISSGARVCGAVIRDRVDGGEVEIESGAVVDTTGPWAGRIGGGDEMAGRVRLTKGVHIILPRLPCTEAFLLLTRRDRRVLFFIPWYGKTLVGTTDTPVSEPLEEPQPLAEEVEFILRHAARYLTEDPTPEDVLSTFAGLRPLVGGGDEGDTAALSRDHTLTVSESGLVTIIGGKWTTYRRMAEDAVDHAAPVAGLELRDCITRELPIHGYHHHPERFGPFAFVLNIMEACLTSSLLNYSE